MKFFCFVLLVLISLTLVSCFDERLIEKLDYVKIEKSNYNESFSGVVKSKNSTVLSFQTEGRIIYLPYTKGDFIKKGQVIACLDNTLYEINKKEQEAKLQEYLVLQNRQKKYCDRLNVLHKEGAISDNDWESAYFELKALDAQIKMQKEKIRYNNKQIEFGSIVAPFDGYISSKFIDNDSYARIAAPVVEFISSDGFQVETMVGDSLINKLKINDFVLLEIQGQKYNGKISHISKTSLNSGGYLIKISFNEIKNIKEGMSVNVKFLLSDNDKILVPISLIGDDDGQKYVLKIIDIKKGVAKVQKIEIQTGLIVGDKIEVLNGIKDGDLILLNPFYPNKRVKL
ncbi:MAG: efflux RND transporter periplasmic adaptor subunit [Candidatus Gastranaerophilales bacterium]|nr:efflux RND transporter periplasmic adaptor subunit [Candidatus Gastranaerophilales bacterium]